MLTRRCPCRLQSRRTARRCSSSNARCATPPTCRNRCGKARRWSKSWDGRPVGSKGFTIRTASRRADFAWDEARLDAWLTNPQAVVPGVVMVYRQAKPEMRAAIIAFLKELN
ncbi:hypothetical protein ACVWXO_003927 [Bradyrhizobium sp. LM2.7]